MSKTTTTSPADNPLFYANPVPLDREKHRELKLGSGEPDYGYARGAHFIPALIDEFSAASREMPILFVPGAKGPTAVFMVGLETGRSRLVKADGSWARPYVPAYLRRYPFILGEVEGQDPLVMIDEENSVLSLTEGEALFGEDGEPSAALNNAIGFTNEFFAAGKRTEAFIELLTSLDLFRQITIETRAAGAEVQTIHGLLAVDEGKLYELSDADFLKLRDERVLSPIFAHFFSLTQIDRLRDEVQA
ncbi:SapC family protein [Fulvimarina endophytica]|uniref:SapC family protein n=1 Tax=Fulvimarina endophytica TaxID=2293836 RepID=A0A371X9W1_9HYPH|nr:SapC family protein [Fulvimarina endophytica]RFC65996.1 SapC family protein [Fulvimarina endophytica]